MKLPAVARLSGLKQARAVTIVMVEHLVKALFGISDRVTVLSAGEKIAEGTPEMVASDPRVIEAYLGTGGEVTGEAIALA